MPTCPAPTAGPLARSDFRVSVHGSSVPPTGRTTLTLRDVAVFELATLDIRESLAATATGYLDAVMCVGCNGTCAGCGGCGGGCATVDEGL